MPRYVILEHDYPVKHWDFMVETGEVLRTWKLPSPPKTGLGLVAEQSFDHRPIYLDFEGPISGGRGSVTRWDSGSFQTMVDEDNRVKLRLRGQRLHGEAIFSRNASGQWSFSFQESRIDP